MAQAADQHHLIFPLVSRHEHQKFAYEYLLRHKQSSGDVLYNHWLCLSQESSAHHVGMPWNEQDALGQFNSHM